jgi:type II secretory pathway pseudopilin PulG
MILFLAVAALAVAQAAYQPKFPGDPARSDSEAQALGYMRTVLRAQKQYNKKYGKFADSLNSLVHTGSFTRRMATTDRGDYKVGFHSKKDGFQLALTPKQLDAQHRSFYAEDDGKIHAEDDKPATDSSPVVK